MPDMPDGFFRYTTHEVVDALDAVAGRERVEAYAFDRTQFPGGDVVRHFLGCVGVAADALRLTEANPGLGLLAVKLLYIYRSQLARRDSDLGSPWSLEPFIASLGGMGGPQFQLRPDLCRKIAEINQSAYDWSARRLPRPFFAPDLTEGADESVRGAEDLLRLGGAGGRRAGGLGGASWRVGGSRAGGQSRRGGGGRSCRPSGIRAALSGNRLAGGASLKRRIDLPRPPNCVWSGAVRLGRISNGRVW